MVHVTAHNTFQFIGQEGSFYEWNSFALKMNRKKTIIDANSCKKMGEYSRQGARNILELVRNYYYYFLKKRDLLRFAKSSVVFLGYKKLVVKVHNAKLRVFLKKNMM